MDFSQAAEFDNVQRIHSKKSNLSLVKCKPDAAASNSSTLKKNSNFVLGQVLKGLRDSSDERDGDVTALGSIPSVSPVPNALSMLESNSGKKTIQQNDSNGQGSPELPIKKISSNTFPAMGRDESRLTKSGLDNIQEEEKEGLSGNGSHVQSKVGDKRVSSFQRPRFLVYNQKDTVNTNQVVEKSQTFNMKTLQPLESFKNPSHDVIFENQS